MRRWGFKVSAIIPSGTAKRGPISILKSLEEVGGGCQT